MASDPGSEGGSRALTIDGLRKAYGATQALRGLSLRAEPDQVVGIVGPNGAGKSTLVKILAGEQAEDGGAITVDGRPLPVAHRRRIVAVVHQEPQLFPNLTVIENCLIDSTGMRRPRPAQHVYELLDRLQLGRVAKVPLDYTSIVVWQLTEIARALLRSAEVFLFDEPNSALTREGSQRLFEQMAALRDAGKFVFLVSHRLGEVADTCRQVMVVRDGTVVASLSGESVRPDRLASLLTADDLDAVREDSRRPGHGGSPVGQQLADRSAPQPGSAPPAAAGPAGPESPAASAPAVPGRQAHLRIEGVPGRVVAVTGPEGGGGRELTRTALVVPGTGGDSGGRVGRAYLPADRRHSLFFNMSVAANISSRLSRGQLPGGSRLVSRGDLAKAAASYIDSFGIKTEHAGASVGSLSGGNQQKVALASALAVGPALLIVEEPTRGVDIRTKLQIYEILRSFAAAGGAVVMFVTELEDALGCADRLLVVSDGTVRGQIDVGPEDDLEELGLAVSALLNGGLYAA